jgi:hypothetical protein
MATAAFGEKTMNEIAKVRKHEILDAVEFELMLQIGVIEGDVFSFFNIGKAVEQLKWGFESDDPAIQKQFVKSSIDSLQHHLKAIGLADFAEKFERFPAEFENTPRLKVVN